MDAWDISGGTNVNLTSVRATALAHLNDVYSAREALERQFPNPKTAGKDLVAQHEQLVEAEKKARIAFAQADAALNAHWMNHLGYVPSSTGNTGGAPPPPRIVAASYWSQEDPPSNGKSSHTGGDVDNKKPRFGTADTFIGTILLWTVAIIGTIGVLYIFGPPIQRMFQDAQARAQQIGDNIDEARTSPEATPVPAPTATPTPAPVVTPSPTPVVVVPPPAPTPMATPLPTATPDFPGVGATVCHATSVDGVLLAGLTSLQSDPGSWIYVQYYWNADSSDPQMNAGANIENGTILPMVGVIQYDLTRPLLGKYWVYTPACSMQQVQDDVVQAMLQRSKVTTTGGLYVWNTTGLFNPIAN